MKSHHLGLEDSKLLEWIDWKAIGNNIVGDGFWVAIWAALKISTLFIVSKIKIPGNYKEIDKTMMEGNEEKPTDQDWESFFRWQEWCTTPTVSKSELYNLLRRDKFGDPTIIDTLRGNGRGWKGLAKGRQIEPNPGGLEWFLNGCLWQRRSDFPIRKILYTGSLRLTISDIRDVLVRVYKIPRSQQGLLEVSLHEAKDSTPAWITVYWKGEGTYTAHESL